MPDFGVALSWMILSPIAFFTNLVMVLVVLHYRPLFHSCDVALTSLLVTMATNALLLLPIQAVMELGDFHWGETLCTFFVWLSVTLRSSNLLALLAASVYWMASLRVTVKGHMFTSSKYMKLSVCVCWLISVVVGLIPATGGTVMFHFYTDGSCRFLPANISVGFALVFIVMPLLTFVMGLVSTADSWTLFRRMKDIALARHDAGGFSLPTASASAAPGGPAVHARYSELNVSADLCRLVLVYTLVSTGINGLPLMVSQFVQLVQGHDRVAMETVLLWLVLLESLLLPHLLWLLSDRYRHAAVYTWKVFVLRDKNAREEDAAACTLQAYRFKERVLYARPYTNGSGPPKANGAAVRPIPDHHGAGASPQPAEHRAPARSNGYDGGHDADHRGRDNDIMTTDLDDGMTALTQLTSATPVNLQATDARPHPDRVVAVAAAATEAGSRVPPRKSPRALLSGVNRAPTSPPPPLPPTTLQTLGVPDQVSPSDVKRSASSSSRQEWKDKMRKKYLPAVLLDNSFEVDSPDSVPDTDTDADKEGRSSVRVTTRGADQLPSTASTDSSYYISGDYHYEYLSDSGPPPLQQQWTCDSEGDAYGSCDIVDVLDESDAGDSASPRSETEDDAAHPKRDLVVTFVHGTSPQIPGGDVMKGHVDMEIINRPSRTIPRISRNAAAVSIPVQNGPSTNQPNVLDVQFEDSDSVTTPDVVTAATLHGTTPPVNPVIRRDNYRKFLPYTNLVVSSVDVEDNTFGGDAAGPDASKEVSPSTSTPQQKQLSESNTPKGDKTLSQSDSLSTDGTSMLSNEESDSEEVPNEEEPSDEAKKTAVQQDYGGLETVSGSEMLRLKMSSVRRATAMDSTDDSTNSDSDPEQDQTASAVTAYDPPGDQGAAVQRATHRAENRINGFVDDGEFSPDTSAVSGDRASTRYVLGIESEDDVARNVKERHLPSPAVKPKPPARAKRQNGQASTANPSPAATTLNPFPKSPPRSRESRQAEFVTNPFLRESFEIASQNRQARSHTNPFLNASDIFIGSEAASSSDRFPEKTAPVSTTRPGGHSIVKPPRNRENSLKKKSSRHTSSEDELDSILNGDEVTDNNTSFTDSTASSPIESSPRGLEASHRTHQADTTGDSDGAASDKSVVLEPYGERRPAWMEDPLISSHGTVFLKDHLNTESDTDGFENAFAPSTFRVTVSDDTSDEVVEYDFDAVSVGGVDYGNNRLLQYNRPPAGLVHYQFDDETDRGFEDALSYNHHGYGGLGLCFEAIQEETEESLSESIASLDGNELSDSTNIFKTQAVVSRPSSRASVFSPSLKEHPGVDEQQQFFSDDLQDKTDSFPIFERTSADGSEEILPPYNGHGSKTPPRMAPDPWGGKPPRAQNHIVLVPQVHAAFRDGGDKDIETADDIVTALAFNPDHRGQAVQSPWSDVDAKDQVLDMSFDSDFSQGAVGTDSKIRASPFDDVFGIGFPAGADKAKIAPAYF